MHKANQEKTSFVTSQGLFCYKVMPFGLKNAGATYQRLMNKMFAQQLTRNIQVYVNDMLVKSQREEDHLEDLRETFNTLRSYNMKFNPGKCAFRVTVGKFLRFMVSQRGIEQGSQYRTGGCTGLVNGTIYFGYRSIPVYRFGFTAIFYIYKYIYIYIYMYVCMYVCMCVCVYIL